MKQKNCTLILLMLNLIVIASCNKSPLISTAEINTPKKTRASIQNHFAISNNGHLLKYQSGTAYVPVIGTAGDNAIRDAVSGNELSLVLGLASVPTSGKLFALVNPVAGIPSNCEVWKLSTTNPSKAQKAFEIQNTTLSFIFNLEYDAINNRFLAIEETVIGTPIHRIIAIHPSTGAIVAASITYPPRLHALTVKNGQPYVMGWYLMNGQGKECIVKCDATNLNIASNPADGIVGPIFLADQGLMHDKNNDYFLVTKATSSFNWVTITLGITPPLASWQTNSPAFTTIKDMAAY